jgi:signal transduction histidine kinase
VLVVEDTPDVARMIRLALHQDFRFLAAGDGEQGLELARRLPTDRRHYRLDDAAHGRPRAHAAAARRRADEAHPDRHADGAQRRGGQGRQPRDRGQRLLGKPFSANELVSTVRSLVRAREATAEAVLTQKLDSLEAIAGGLAHEIGNPLNYVKNALATVQRDCQTLLNDRAEVELGPPQSGTLKKLDARIHKMFEVTEAGVKRIASTVDLMVRYSREGYSRTPQLHDAYAAVNDVVAVVVPTVGRQVQLEVQLEGNGWIRCVAEEFNQVLTNLIQNAIEAVAADGSGRVLIRGSNVLEGAGSWRRCCCRSAGCPRGSWRGAR